MDANAELEATHSMCESGKVALSEAQKEAIEEAQLLSGQVDELLADLGKAEQDVVEANTLIDAREVDNAGLQKQLDEALARSLVVTLSLIRT